MPILYVVVSGNTDLRIKLLGPLLQWFMCRMSRSQETPSLFSSPALVFVISPWSAPHDPIDIRIIPLSLFPVVISSASIGQRCRLIC